MAAQVKALEKQDAEVLSLAELTEIEFKRLYDELDVANAPEKRKADAIDAIWSELYDMIFKPSIDEVMYNNCKSRLIPYKVEDVEAVCKTFINLNRLYGGVIKFTSFSELTGIHTYTIELWHKANNTNGYIFSLSDTDIQGECNNIYIINHGNGDIEYKGNNRYTLQTNNELSHLRFDVKKKLREAMQGSNTNGLSNDTMGHAMRANNEDELGKLYEPRRMIQQEQVKRVLTSNDLLKLSQELSQKDTQLTQIETQNNT